MQWLKRLLGKKESTFTGDFIDSGEELLELASSNPVVAAELKEFESQVSDKSCAGNQDQIAFKSAEALSGYGISVSKKAFLETTEYH
jgi:hypothetical protein